MAKLKAKKRSKLPASAFAYPGTRKFPIYDRAHARNALARAAQSKTSGSYAHVAAAVHRRFSDIVLGGKAKGKRRGTTRAHTSRRTRRR
jgi:hypothetical protein